MPIGEGSTGDMGLGPTNGEMLSQEFSPEDIQTLLGGVLPEPVSNDRGHSDFSVGASSKNVPTLESQDNDSDRMAARTERKRKLEKKRRSDVNRQFAELQATLRGIESDDPNQVSGLPSYSPSNRVDLIGRTISLLKFMHGERKRLKSDVKDLEDRLERAQKAGEEAAAKAKDAVMAPQAMGNNKVVMMVPMLIGGGNNSAGGGVSMMQPWMPNPMGPPDGNNTGTQAAMPPSWMPSAGTVPWIMAPGTPMIPPGGSGDGKPSEGKKKAPPEAPATQGNLAHCA